MSIIQYAEQVLSVRLSYYQKELLMLLDTNKRGYLHDVVSKKPTQEIRAVVEVYQKYCEEMLVSA